MQVTVSGEAGVEMAKRKVISGMLGRTGFKGNADAKATAEEARSETQHSAEGWGALGHQGRMGGLELSHVKKSGKFGFFLGVIYKQIAGGFLTPNAFS